MKILQTLPFIIFFMMIHSSSFAQTESALYKLLESKQEVFVKPYYADCENTPNLIKAETIRLSLMEDNNIECKLYYKDVENADYWFFKIDKENNLSDISHENNLWLYIDNNATGTYKFQEDTGVEILEIDFSIHGNKSRYIIRWKNKQKN